MKLILCGGGSGDQNTLANKKLNEIIDHSKPILYVPLAINETEHSFDDCYKWITEELINVEKNGIEMVRSFDDLAKNDYFKYSAVFIGGGNTYKLLKGLKESGSFSKLKEYIDSNGVIIGESAGAVIFGKDINIVSSMDQNDEGLQDTAGFNVINNVSIFPHYTNYKSKYTEEENRKIQDIYTKAIIDYSYSTGKVIAIPEENAIFIFDDTFEIIGTKPYYEFENGNIQKKEIDHNKKLSK